MVSITRLWKKLPFTLLLLALQAVAAPVGELSHDGRMYSVDAQLKVKLDDELVDLLRQGIPLDFVAEFDLTGPSWYSWYRAVASGFLENNEKHMRLSYHAISRHYRLSAGDGVRDYRTVDEALHDLGRLRDWQVLQVDRFNKKTMLKGRIRMRLDTALSPSLHNTPLSDRKTELIDSRWRALRSVGPRRARAHR